MQVLLTLFQHMSPHNFFTKAFQKAIKWLIRGWCYKKTNRFDQLACKSPAQYIDPYIPIQRQHKLCIIMLCYIKLRLLPSFTDLAISTINKTCKKDIVWYTCIYGKMKHWEKYNQSYHLFHNDIKNIFKGALDEYNIIPQLFSEKKLGFLYH